MSIIGKRRDLWVSLLVLVLAGGLRFCATLDDLWLDEIWSWGHLQVRVTSAWDVFFKLRHDNNHLLNSWWMYALGPDADRVWYRLPCVIFGSLTVLLARQVVAKSGPVAVWIVTLLTVPSYFLIHYSSEARGYGYQMFFSLASYLLLERLLHEDQSATLPTRRQQLRDRGLFALSCIAGALSHPAFLMTFIALMQWAFLVKIQQRQPLRARVIWRLEVFAVPLVLIGLLWWLNYSRMEIGGADPQLAWVIALETLSLMVGGPEVGDSALVIGLGVVVAVLMQLVFMIRTKDNRWNFVISTMVVPAVLLSVMGNRMIFPRYLLGPVVFLLPMLALLLARCFTSGTAGRWIVVGIMAATLAGNGWQLARLYRDGRGHGQSVVKYLRDHTPDGPILVGSDQRFRHGLILDYFGRRLGYQDRLVHFGEGPWPPGGPQWILMHSQELTWTPPPDFTDPQGQRYDLREVFPYAGLSGWHTAIYERTK